MPRIDETLVIKRIKADIIQEYLGGKIWHIDEILGLIASYAFPMLGYTITPAPIEIAGTIMNIIDAVRTHSRRRTFLNNYSKQGLYDYFVDQWASLMLLNEKKQLLRGLTLINGIEDYGYVSLRGNNNAHEAILRLAGEVNLPYGTEEYTREEMNTNANDIPTPPATEIRREERMAAAETINRIMNAIAGIEGFNDKFPRYIWQLQISGGTYNQLKEALKVVCNCRSHNNAFWDKYSKALLIYVAEWFKRERDTNETENNGVAKVFSDINLNIANAGKKICDKLNIDAHETESHSRWLSTLYTFGGFPLKDRTHFKILCEKIYKLKKENGDDDKTIEGILQIFRSNDQAFRQSLKDDNGSIRKYVEYIWEHDSIPMNKDQEDEVTQSLIDAWNTAIQEGRQKVEKKFNLDWEAQYYEGNLKLTLLLSLELNTNKNIDRSNISVDELSSNGIVVGDKFRLIVKNGDNVLRKWPFYMRTKDGISYYTNYEGYERYVLASDIKEGYQYGVLTQKTERNWNSNFVQKGKIDFTKPIKILIETEDRAEPITYKEISIDEHVTFKFKQHFMWDSFIKSGKIALFLPRYDEFDDNGNELSPNRVGTSGWLPINTILRGCKYNGKAIKEVIPHVDGDIVIEATEKMFKDVICYKDGKAPSYIHNDITENGILLLRDKDNIVISHVKKVRNEKKITTINKSECNFKYMQFDNNGELQEVEETNIRPGYLEVVVKYLRKSETAKCFIVPNDFTPKSANVTSGDEEFEEECKLEEFSDANGKLIYSVYKGAGLYNKATNRKLGKNGGVIKHLNSYYYRNAQGAPEFLYTNENKYKALRKVYEEIGQANINSSRLTITKDNEEYILRPFSNKRIEENNGKYCIQLSKIDSENNTLDGCLFYYRTFNDLLNRNKHDDTVEKEKTEDGQYMVLKFTPSDESDGLLFQSLKETEGDNSTSEYYFRPVFVHKTGTRNSEIKDASKKDRRIKNINEKCKTLKEGNFDEAVKSFIFATEHNLYYTSLDSLVALVYREDIPLTKLPKKKFKDEIEEVKYIESLCRNQPRINTPDVNMLVKFYFAYLDYCKKESRETDLKALYALSDELLFDWWFIPKHVWNKYTDKKKEDNEQLLLAKPTITGEEQNAKKDIVTHYWEDFAKNKKIRNLAHGQNSLKVANSIRSNNHNKENNFFYIYKTDWNKRNLSNYEYSFISLKKLLISE